MSDTTASVRVAPGPGLIARYGQGVLVAVDPVVESQIAPLLAIVRQACEGHSRPGVALARRIAQHLLDSDPQTVPSFAALAPAEEGWAVTLHGDVELSVARGEGQDEHVSGRHAATWVDRIVAGGFTRLAIGRDAAGVEIPGGPFDLEAGVVPGGGVVVDAAARPFEADASATSAAAPPGAHRPAAGEPAAAEPPASAVPSAPVPPPDDVSAAATRGDGDPELDTAPHSEISLPSPEQPERGPTPSTPPAPPADAAAEPFEAVSLLEPEGVDEREPLAVLGGAVPAPGRDAGAQDAASEAPLVEGVLCRNEHFNHPQARYCSVCGVAMVHRTLAPVRRPRPPLGVLVSDDGSAYSLDHDHLVGREPENDDRVAAGELMPLQLEDAERSVSRVHAEIRLEGWDVTVTDRDSANGTYVAARDETQWRPLAAGQPQRLTPGTRIAFGKRIMTFDSHHQAEG